MEYDFSFVLVSSVQPSSSSKKIRNKAGKTTPNRKQSNGRQNNCRKKSIKCLENSLFKELNKENNYNQDNFEMRRITRKSSSSLSGHNSSLEFPALADLKNICIRRPTNTRNDDVDSASNVKSTSSPGMFNDRYDISLSDDDLHNSKAKIISETHRSSTNSNKSLLDASSSLNRRSNSTTNSSDCVIFRRPKRKANKIIETPESDYDVTNTSSNPCNESSCKSDSHPRKKLRSSNSSSDVSVVEPSIVKPSRRKISTSLLNSSDKMHESSTNEILSSNDSKNSNISEKERKLFKGNKKINRKISLGKCFDARRSSIRNSNENKDSILSDMSVIEPSIETPKNKSDSNNKKVLKEINKKISPNNKTKVKLKKVRPQVKSPITVKSPPLSADKLQNINEWLDETTKHTDFKVEPDDLMSKENKVGLILESNDKEEFDASDASFCSESGISEKILNKMYGTVWQEMKKEMLPQSEPRKGYKKKKQRLSIYEAFSSSSSEDRFEQFLENVNRAKIKPRNSAKKLSTPDFINDSSTDNNTSMTFYQAHLAKDVQSDVGNVLQKKLDLTTLQLPKAKKNQRKLSFTSSSDSESSINVKKKTKPRSKSVKNTDKSNNLLIKNDNLKSNKVNNVNVDGKKTKGNDKILTPKYFNCPIEDFVDLITPKKDKRSSLKLTAVDLVTPKSVKKPAINNKENKIQFNPNFVEADLTPFLSRKKRKETEENGATGPLSVKNTPLPKTKNGSPGLTLSFLSSLSEETGNLKCHPEAIEYKKNYKKKKEELAKKLFNLYNKEVFENKLPSDLQIQWNSRMRSTSGYCYNKRTNVARGEIVRSSRLALSTKILDRPGRLRDTLIHELCHAATWLINGKSDGHGSEWRAWADRATKRFPELPRIKRCHDYSIQTKYTYKCMGCGYCIGRHSKSLDVNLKRCGYCYGKFEVFLTSKVNTKLDAMPSESDSVKVQRAPAFAMFVKENYGKVKQEHDKLAHGALMKLLGQKFAAVKLSKG